MNNSFSLSESIIDVHAHVFENISGFGYRGELRSIGNGKARWATGEEVHMLISDYGDNSFTYERLIQEMDKCDVEKAVLLQGSFYGFANEYVFEAQQSYPDRLFGMGTFDPYCLEFEKIMYRLIDDFKFRGLKFELSTYGGFMGYHPDYRLDSNIMKEIWEFANEREFIVSLDMGKYGDSSFQIVQLKEVAKRYKNIKIVVEHLFSPNCESEEILKGTLEFLSEEKNIFFTTATLPFNTSPEAYPYNSACRYLEIAKTVIGTERLMWGSDIPSVVTRATYKSLIDYIFVSKIFDQKELYDLFRGTAQRVYCF